MSLTKQDLKSIEKIVDKRIYRTETLFEDLSHKFTGVIEGIAGIHQQISVLPAMQTDLEEVKIDVKAIKAVVINHEDRLKVLETI